MTKVNIFFPCLSPIQAAATQVLNCLVKTIILKLLQSPTVEMLKECQRPCVMPYIFELISFFQKKVFLQAWLVVHLNLQVFCSDRS